MPAQISYFNKFNQPKYSKFCGWPEVKEMVSNPIFFDVEITSDDHNKKMKLSLPSMSATNCQTKTRDDITAHNQMHFLRVDSDDGLYTIDSLTKALANVGINTFAIHSSWRHEPSFPKLKALIPLIEPMTCDEWQDKQERLTECLGTDTCMDKRGQISFVPATYKGREYLHYIHEAGMHDFELLPKLKPKPIAPPRDVKQFNSDEGSIIDLYCSDNSLETLLMQEGYKKIGKKYLSPGSSSGIPGGWLKIGDDGKQYFGTMHESDPVSRSEGCVDAFGFMCIRSGQTPFEFARDLGANEYKEFTKEKQVAFAKKQDCLVDADAVSAEFAAMFTVENLKKGQEQTPPTAQKPKRTKNSFFGDIKAPVDGHYDMNSDINNPLGDIPTAKEQHVAKVLSKPQFVEIVDEKKAPLDTSYVFPTPVDETIDIHSAPGVVGMCIDYINRMGRKPRKTLAVSMALSSVGMVGGLSHFDGEYGATSNIFCFNIAGSGTGKEAILQAGSDIVDASGLGTCVLGKIKSEQELYRNLINSQATYYNIDEIGEVLGKITASKESYHSGIIGSLMSLYSKAYGTMKLGGDELKEIKEFTKKRVAYLNKENKENVEKDKEPMRKAELKKLNEFYALLEQNILLNPFLAISGCTTPELFAEIATRKNVLSGFIGRSLMFREFDDAPRSHRVFNPYKDFPLDLANRLMKIKNCGNQDLIEVGRIQNYGDKVEVTTTKDAKEWIDSLIYNVESQSIESAKTDGLSAIFNRQIELVLKVSLILAIGDGKVRTLQHVKWAQKVVAGDVETKINLVRGNDSDEEGSKQEKLELLKDKVVEFLKKRDGAFLPSVISKGIRNSKKIEVESVLMELSKSGAVSHTVEKGKLPKFKLSE